MAGLKINNDFQAVAYLYWYSKIRERANGVLIDITFLKDVIQREIICDDNKGRKGGNKKGIPKRFLYALINDLRGLNLIKRINHSTYEIIPNNYYRKILKQPFPFDK